METVKEVGIPGVISDPVDCRDARRTRLNRSRGIAEILDRYGGAFLADSRNGESSHDQSAEAEELQNQIDMRVPRPGQVTYRAWCLDEESSAVTSVIGPAALGFRG